MAQMTSSTSDLLSTFRRKPVRPRPAGTGHLPCSSSAFSNWVDLSSPDPPLSQTTTFNEAAAGPSAPATATAAATRPLSELGLGRPRPSIASAEHKRSFSFSRKTSGSSSIFSLPWKRKQVIPLLGTNDENVDPLSPLERSGPVYQMQPLQDEKRGYKDSRGGLKRRSMELLRLVSEGKSHSSHGHGGKTKGRPCIATPPRTSRTPSCSTPSLTSFSRQTPLTPFPDISIVPGTRTPSASASLSSLTASPPPHRTTPPHSPPPRLSTPRFHPLYPDLEMTPPSDRPYPFVVGDSPFHHSSRKGSLRPRYSRVPHNTPDTSGNSSSSGLGISGTVLPPLTQTRFLDQVLPPPNVALDDSRFLNDHLNLRVRACSGDPILADAEPPFEVSPALEALWEYGSTDSSSSSVLEQPSESFFPSRQSSDSGSHEEDTEPALDASTTRRSDYNIPIPVPAVAAHPRPSAIAHSISNRSTDRSSTMISSPMSISTLASLSVIDDDHDLYIGDIGEDQVQCVTVSTARAYRIPLKFERPEARRNESGDSPFSAVCQTDSPQPLLNV